jgi:hypothetical protein
MLPHSTEYVCQYSLVSLQNPPYGTFPVTTDNNGLPTDGYIHAKKPAPAPAQLGGKVAVSMLREKNIAVRRLDMKTAGGKRAAAAAPAPALAGDGITIGVDTKQLGHQIPLDFLGLSLEWGAMTFYGQSPETWATMFAIFGKHHVIRIGGGSQELLTEVRGGA